MRLLSRPTVTLNDLDNHSKKEVKMSSFTMKRLSYLLLATAAFSLLTIANIQADPPQNRCDFNVYHCRKSSKLTESKVLVDPPQVHVFAGNDDAHLVATWEGASLRSSSYYSAHCNHTNCDTTVYIAFDREWITNHCGDISIVPISDRNFKLEKGFTCDSAKHQYFEQSP